MAVLVSKMDHCLFDLLIRQRNGELRCDIPVVISNHPDLRHVAKMFDVDYEHLGFKKDLDKAVAKQQQEAAIEKVREGAEQQRAAATENTGVEKRDGCLLVGIGHFYVLPKIDCNRCLTAL